MTERTQGQWQTFPSKQIIDEYPENRIGIQNREGLLVADCGLAGNRYSRGNAEFIVRAVNSHEAMLEALEAMTSAIRGCSGLNDVLGGAGAYRDTDGKLVGFTMEGLLSDADKAIRAAKGDA